MYCTCIQCIYIVYMYCTCTYVAIHIHTHTQGASEENGVQRKKKEDFSFDKIIGEGSYSTVCFVSVYSIHVVMPFSTHNLCIEAKINDTCRCTLISLSLSLSLSILSIPPYPLSFSLHRLSWQPTRLPRPSTQVSSH